MATETRGVPASEDINRRLQDHRQRTLAIRRLRRHKAAVVGGAILVVMVLSAVFAPIIAPYDPIDMDLEFGLSAPSLRHLFGTDSFGRDILSRILFGARVSLLIGLTSVGWAALVGVPVGLVAGYSGGTLGTILMRMVDALLSFPPILLAIAISASMGGGQGTVIFALGMIYVPVFARLVRGSTLSLREEVFVMAAESYGAGTSKILLRHILPNMVGIIVVQATIGFSSAIISEATLSFLGLGVPPPLPSWGRDLNDARGFIRDAWWMILVPATTIIINVLGINFLGDGLRDALDPRMRTRG
jgi:ABC-type dipeptide/oligopeptide/nickel transport system permease subunit